MKRTILITNTASGSANSVDEDVLLDGLKSGGFDVARRVTLPEGDLPDRAAVESDDIDVVAILSGDGTISSLCTRLAGWSGAVLVLPGGTMNLLSRRLHGDVTLTDLLGRLAGGSFDASAVSVIKVDEQEIYTGLIAGRSTQWGEVRESIRNLDIGELVEKVPEAWAATTTGDNVRVEGIEGGYPAIFVEPTDNGNLSVRAFRADGVGDMLSHGVAWLRRDFRDGPNDDLGEMAEVTIIDDSDQKLGVLIDGEQDEAKSPLKCVAAMSSVRFLRRT